MSAFKDNAMILSSPFSLPKQISFEPFVYIFSKYDFGRYFINSFLISVSSTLLALIFFAMGSYVLAKYEFPGKNLIFILYTVTLLVPAQSKAQPIFSLIMKLGLYDNIWGVALVYVSMGLAISTFILKPAFMAVPKSLDEARTKFWLKHTDAIRGLIAAVKERLVFLRQQLARKQGELFQPLTLEESSTDSSLTGKVDVEILNAIIRGHNNDIDNYDQLKKQVCNDVVQYYIEEVRAEYSTALDAIQNIQDSLATAKQQRDDNSTELKRLKNSQQDRAHFAQLLTTDLHRYFGRDELTFELSDDNGYLIQRNGQKADHLSEGEQRSIALLYFLRDIESNGANLRERIVVFDDPVSSVDDGAATGAFAYIWDKCIGKKQSGVGQLIVLTHNFDFFRRWINGLDSTFKGKNQQSEYSICELRASSSQNAEGGQTRTPYFVLWDDPTRYAQLRSEYHYLFWRAAKALASSKDPDTGIIDSYDTAMLPNVCRRLLEGFLSFRYPQYIGSFRNQMSVAIDQLEDSASRNHMLRLMHEYSHNEQCDTAKPIQMLETPMVVEHIFKTIQKLDQDHYTAMCEALDVAPLSLPAMKNNSTNDSNAARSTAGAATANQHNAADRIH